MIQNLTAVTQGESLENLDQVAPYLDGSVEETLKLIPVFGDTPQKDPGNLMNPLSYHEKPQTSLPMQRAMFGISPPPPATANPQTQRSPRDF
jgi:hypothetical protein